MMDNNGHTGRMRGWDKLFAQSLIAAMIVTQACVGQTSGAADGEKLLFQNMASVTMEANVHSWRVGDDGRLAQRTFPLSVTMPVSDRTLLTLSAVPASVNRSGGSISGVPDARFGASYVLPGEKLWLTGAVTMPGGATRLSAAETEIAASIAQPALGYPVASMGHGLNTTWGCAYASSVSRQIVFGFGAAFSTKGAYEPVAPSETSTMTYAPGNEIAANIGIDYRDRMKTDRLSADYTVTYYFSDKLNGERFFQSGVKAALVLAASRSTRGMVHMVRVRLETRAHHVSVAGRKEEESPAASQASARYSITMPLGGVFSLTMGLGAETMTSDEFPVNGGIISTGGGTVGAFSAECAYEAAPWCFIAPHASFGVGSVTVMNSERHAAGFDAGIGIKFLL